jgi:hypothetical protein
MSDEIPIGPGNPTGGYGLDDLRSLPSSTGSGTSTLYHMSLSVRGALNWPKREMRRLAKCLIKSDGSKMTPEEARNALMDQLALGHEQIPIGDRCDNWDWKEGCLGHRVQLPSPNDKSSDGSEPFAATHG